MLSIDTLLSNARNKQPLKIDQLNIIYDQLDTIPCEAMLGRWRGVCLNTGHPGEEKLSALGWQGKEFIGLNDVSPILCLNENNVLQASTVMGGASLRMVEFRGQSTATMVYDQHPIFDHFKQIKTNIILGVMDAKSEELPLYFLLERD